MGDRETTNHYAITQAELARWIGRPGQSYVINVRKESAFAADPRMIPRAISRPRMTA